MAGEWPIRTIAECASPEPYSTQIGPFGHALMANEYTKSGVPVLRGVNVNRGRFHDDDFVFIDEETADRLRKYEALPGDVLLVHKGTLGQIGILPRNPRYPRYIMGNSMLRVRCDLSKILPGYLYYWLSSADGQHYLFSRVSQVGVPQIQMPLTTLRQATLPVPPLPVQRAIAYILGTLDDKIELNQEMNETLEAIARALFKSWFVDFDPVRAKAEGRDSGLPKPLADLFPNYLVDSELGEIPAGWEVVDVGTLAEVTSGKRPPVRFPEPTDDVQVPLWGGNGPMAFVSEPLFQSPILLTGRVGTLGSVFRITSPCWPSDNTLVVLARDEVAHEFLYFRLRQVDFSSLNRGSTQPLLTQTDLKAQRFVISKANLLQHFHKVVGTLFGRVDALQNESRTLAAIRDALLPKLLSGEIRVKDAERFVEARF